MNSIDQSYLKDLLHYCPELGVFTWINPDRRGPTKPGDRAGHLKSDGYVAIKIHSHQYKAHRLAWLYMMGEMPKKEIDHINLIRDDNRFVNLREADRHGNNQNIGMQKNNTVGLKGVSFEKDRNKYTARIGFNGKKINLGRFRTPEEAHAEYCKAAAKYFGEFARFA